jgi:outer membrane protein TolC
MSVREQVAGRVLGTMLAAALAGAGGCATERRIVTAELPPGLAATTQPAVAPLALDRAAVGPMYREVLALDLATVARVALADNLEIRQARERVEAARGRVEAGVEAFFPSLAPAVTVERQQGVARAVQGQLVPVDFSFLQASVALQWVLNPTRVWYDLVAARRRLAGAREEEQFTRIETLRVAAVQYYDLALAQARVGAARQALGESEELLRIARVRLRAGAGVRADETRAAAAVAARRQDLRLELNGFYQASVELAGTLRLDPSVTLVPAPSELRAVALVRGDADVEQLLGVAVRNRPDLREVRELAEAVGAERRALAWSPFVPQVQAAVQESGMGSHVPGDSSGLQEQQREGAGVSWSLGLASLGQYKAARADERAAAVEAMKVFERVRGQVVKAHQESLAQEAVIPAALEQLTAAEESLRLAQVNLRAGTLTTLDVLVAEDAVAQARVRHAQAVVRYNQSQVNLTAALGALTGTPLGVVAR